ncbi:MAG: hypothetical protein HRF45_03845 [Fimbriimonadia bacterium]|jgi:phosphomannomutase
MSANPRWLQSYSGVRAVVGQGPDVLDEDKLFAFRHAYCYAVSRLQAWPSPEARFVFARDPRPTGSALAAEQAAGVAAACRDLGVQVEVIDLGVVTTPVWQHAVRVFEAHGGVMVTASHNPLDNNGWKYATGVETHGVDPAPPGALLSPAEMGNLIRAANSFSPKRTSVEVQRTEKRAEAVQHYLQFIRDAFRVRASAGSVVLDPNGGAACGIAEELFESLGVKPIVVNGEIGRPGHLIDVEAGGPPGKGHVLDALAEQVRAEGALFGLAYDFDADRGNLTYLRTDGATAIPSPQAVAAINTAIALAVHKRSGDSRPAAVVLSDGTSCRVWRIAEAFGARVSEVETGEINVVTQMRELEEQGYAAVVGVEGPNGGTVFAGTTCRDGSLVGAGALLAGTDEALRSLVRETLAPNKAPGPGLAGFISLLPYARSIAERRTTEPMEWSRFVDLLEQRTRERFAERLASDWSDYAFSYSYTRYAGPERPHVALYGWKLCLSSTEGQGFLWVRASKTEAGVLRMIADAPDEPRAIALLAFGSHLLAGESRTRASFSAD